MPSGRHLELESVFLRIAGSRALVLRWCDIEAVAQGELDAARVVVLPLSEHHAVAVEREAIDATIEEVVACQFDVQAVLEEILADTEREHRIGAVKPGVLLMAVSVHIKVSLNQPVVRQGKDIA